MVNGLLRSDATINSNGMGLGNGDATGAVVFVGGRAASSFAIHVDAVAIIVVVVELL